MENKMKEKLTENNFKNLSNTELWNQTKVVAQNEKDATLILLDYLIEVERRRLFAEKSYSSLFEFVVKELGYSESQAAERINSMRLIREIAEVKTHIQSGDLSLTTASQIQRFFKAEKKISAQPPTLKEKVALISECRNQSKREVEKILLEKSSAPVGTPPSERQRLISKELTELKFSVSEGVIQKLQELQNLSDQSMASIFEAGLEALISKAKAKNEDKNKKAQNSTLPAESETYSRYIPKAIRQEIWNRSGGQCEYHDPHTNKRCVSRFRLEFEHCEPFAWGGKSSLENLLHYCRMHNQIAAIGSFGTDKMREFVPSL